MVFDNEKQKEITLSLIKAMTKDISFKGSLEEMGKLVLELKEFGKQTKEAEIKKCDNSR